MALDRHAHDFVVRLDELVADLGGHPHRHVGLLERQRHLVEVALAGRQLRRLGVAGLLQGVDLATALSSVSVKVALAAGLRRRCGQAPGQAARWC